MNGAAEVKQQAHVKTAPETKVKTAAKTANTVEVSSEQIAYANLLQYCSWGGIALLAATFLAYALGLVKAYIPPSEMSLYWGLSAQEFLATTGAPSGWGWIKMLGYGDFLNLVGIAFLALLTIVGYLTLLLPAYLRKKDIPYAAIVSVEILVLVLAASGILVVGAH